MNKEQVELLKSDIDGWNAWRKDNPEITPDLRGADLQGANLYKADIRLATFSEAKLQGSNLRWANLYGANLRGANLRGVDLRGADLHNADMQGADLWSADLKWTDIHKANLQGANLQWTDLQWANLQGAKGIKHIGFDPNGWVLVMWLKDGEPWFNAGYHSFSKTDALDHWGGVDYHSPKLGQQYVQAINFLSGLK